MKPPRYILACLWLLLFPCAKGLLAQDVGILGPNGLTSEGIFHRAGIPSATVMFGAELNKYKVLVVTPNALRDNGGPFIKYGEQIRQFVKDGGFLFVLHQNDRGWQDKWLPYRTGNSNGANPLVKIVAKEHALFEGISESDLGAGNKGVILFDTFVDVAPEWKVLATNIDPDGKKKERIAAIECTLGKGRVLIHLSWAGRSRFFKRSNSSRSSVRPSPGFSGTRRNPFTGSSRSLTTSLRQVSVSLKKWNVADGKAVRYRNYLKPGFAMGLPLCQQRHLCHPVRAGNL